MKTIRNHIEELIIDEPFLMESLHEGLINVSALSRKLGPKLNELTGRKINNNAIIMAIKRLELEDIKPKNKKLNKALKNLGDITVRSGLTDYTFKNSKNLEKKLSEIAKEVMNNEFGFQTTSKGIHETTIIVSNNMHIIILNTMKDEETLSIIDELSSITIQLPKENSDVPGLYYYLLGQIAWKGISIVEVISTTNEFTIILKNNQVGIAFETLMSLKK